jgi:hypothetical protein
MATENNLFKSGEVIMVKKSYGFMGFFVISAVLAFLSTQLLKMVGVPDIFYVMGPISVILLFVFAFVLQLIFQDRIYPDSRPGERFDDIVLFDDYLLGRIKLRGGDYGEYKMEFSEIKYVIQENQEEVRIALKEEGKSGMLEWNPKIVEGHPQDYLISKKLTKQQRKELVNYLNSRIKEYSNG